MAKSRSKRRQLSAEEAFGTALRELRKERGFSQEGLAIESEYDRSYMGRLERGEANPSLRMIFALCKLLRVKPSELLKRTEKHL